MQNNTLYANSCVPLQTQFCEQYRGLLIPYTESLKFDLNVFEHLNLQGHSCKGYVPGITSMRCYSEYISVSGSCLNDTINIKKPCKSACQKMYENLLTHCYSSHSVVNSDVCSSYPNTNCVSSNGNKKFKNCGKLFLLFIFVFVSFFHIN